MCDFLLDEEMNKQITLIKLWSYIQKLNNKLTKCPWYKYTQITYEKHNDILIYIIHKISTNIYSAY